MSFIIGGLATIVAGSTHAPDIPRAGARGVNTRVPPFRAVNPAYKVDGRWMAIRNATRHALVTTVPASISQGSPSNVS